LINIGIISDIHQDCKRGEYIHEPKDNIDVMIVAGDLQEGNGIETLVPYVQAGQRVVYITGNHEYYNHSVSLLDNDIAAHAQVAGVDFLQQGTVVIDNVRFIGATLWTNFMLYGEAEKWFVKQACQKGMNDYEYIRKLHKTNYYTRLTTLDVEQMHADQLAYIVGELSMPHDGPTVVVTHHGPSMLSVPPWYKDDKVSGGYVSPLEDIIEKYEPDMWVHGHTHTPFDYELFNTKVVCNPRGYWMEHDKEYAPLVITL
jgi:predicted phosphodiesterase